MAVLFTCSCKRSFPVSIAGKIVSYIDGNKRHPLLSDSQDCQYCILQIEEAIKAKREQMRTETVEV